jgi:hypothetical protein
LLAVRRAAVLDERLAAAPLAFRAPGRLAVVAVAFGAAFFAAAFAVVLRAADPPAARRAGAFPAARRAGVFFADAALRAIALLTFFAAVGTGGGAVGVGS